MFQEIKRHKDNPPLPTATPSSATTAVKVESETPVERRIWLATELSALSKALKKYPVGGAGRWEAICAFVNHSTGASPPFTKDECIEKYNVTVRSKPAGSAVGSNTAASRPAVVTPTPESATAEDVWTTEQDQLLQEALAKYPSTMDKNERWSAIASSVPGKNKKSCVQRFKAIREILLQQQPNK